MDLNTPILSLTGKAPDAFTIRDCFTGFQIFGGTGSGKTSGSGKYIASRFLKFGFGGLVLTVKPDECEEWRQWAKKAGREKDLIIFKPSEPYRFDFINYERNRDGESAGSTVNIVDILTTACDIAKPDMKGGSGDNQFFVDAGNELIAKTVDLISLAQAPMTIRNILEVINAAPTNQETIDLNGRQVNKIFHSKDVDKNGKRIFNNMFARTFNQADSRTRYFSKQQKRDFLACYDYFVNDYAALGDRTRSSVKLNVTTTLYQLLRGEMGLLFCNGIADPDEIEISPEMAYIDGKIIIVDMPVMEWKTVGKLAQGLFKFMFQRAIERRPLKAITETAKPVFIWADEAQYFLNRADMLFLTTARSSGCATVYLTQNIENYYSIMEDSVARSMLGNLQTKIFHQNTDRATNNYASEIIGKSWEEVGSRSFNYSGDAESSGSLGNTKSEQLLNKIEPESFNELRTGGLHNDLTVDGVLFSGGRKWVISPDKSDVFVVAQFKQGD